MRCSIPIDTILFTLVAFAGVFPVPMLISIIFGDMVLKAVISSIVALRRETLARLGTKLATQMERS